MLMKCVSVVKRWSRYRRIFAVSFAALFIVAVFRADAARSQGGGAAHCSEGLAKGGYDMIIIAGQSNAVGAGRGAHKSAASVEWDDRILQVGRHAQDDMRIIPIGCDHAAGRGEGLQFWNRRCGGAIGFGLEFARLYAANELREGRYIVIIPSAMGGTRVGMWLDEEPVVFKGAKIKLYEDMKRRVDVVYKCPGEHRVVAFLWAQGESDVALALRSPELMSPAVYRRKLSTLFRRVSLDLVRSSEGTILAAQLSPTWRREEPRVVEYVHKFDDAIRSVASEHGNASVVSTNGLSANNADIHYDAHSVVRLGERFYRAWQSNMLRVRKRDGRRN